MKVSIKTLKSDVFYIECAASETVAMLKEKISSAYPEFPTIRQKLIFSGKVLTDEVTIGETGVTESDFLVIMATKEKAAPKVSSAPAAAPFAPTTAVAAPASAPTQLAQPAPSNVAQQQQQQPVPAQSTGPSPEIQQIVAMGFPENEARAALLAANGNSTLAIDFLMGGMPIPAAPTARVETTGGSPLDQLRHHPQINHLRSLLQQNPEAIGQVLESIGQQNPELLRLINAHQEEFLALMNEPIDEDAADYEDDQYEDGDGEGDGDGDEGEMPLVELLDIFQSLSEEERQAAAQGLGMTVEQVQQFAQLVGTLSPEQIQQMLGGGGDGGEQEDVGGGGVGGGGGAGQHRDPRHVVSLTQEEMDSVNRLMELGFSQQDAAAAFLACDRNEALAANLLLEGWTAQDLAHY